jgi:hypothetical protein
MMVGRHLWRRFTITLRRLIAKTLDVPASRLTEVATVQYAEVAEYQLRGLVHFHVLVRLDGPKTSDGFARHPARWTRLSWPTSSPGPPLRRGSPCPASTSGTALESSCSAGSRGGGGKGDAVWEEPADAGRRLHASAVKRSVVWSTVAPGRRTHDLRHTAACLWLAKGVDPVTVKAWLGHASIATTNIYLHHLGSSADRAGLERLNALGGAGGARPETRAE